MIVASQSCPVPSVTSRVTLAAAQPWASFSLVKKEKSAIGSSNASSINTFVVLRLEWVGDLFIFPQHDCLRKASVHLLQHWMTLILSLSQMSSLKALFVCDSWNWCTAVAVEVLLALGLLSVVTHGVCSLTKGRLEQIIPRFCVPQNVFSGSTVKTSEHISEQHDPFYKAVHSTFVAIMRTCVETGGYCPGESKGRWRSLMETWNQEAVSPCWV